MRDGNFELRALELSEWQLLRAMRIREATVHPDLFYDSAAMATNYEPSHWQELLSKDGNKFWALFDGGESIGLTGIFSVDADPTGQTAVIGYSFIEPQYRGKGFANWFYRARLEHAVNHKPWKKIITDHRIGNEISKSAIIKHGFTFVEQEVIDWTDGTREYELRYELDLDKLRSAADEPASPKKES
jgi:RimJ/RimL family protein N-acetyltransferase